MTKLKRYLPTAIILLAILTLFLFIKFKKQPPTQEVKNIGPLVTVVPVKEETRPVILEGTGTVQPEHTLILVPQVGGKVAEISSHFENGSFFKKGETLVQIEKSDYEIALKRAEARLLEQDVAYQKMLKQAHIAEKEWEDIAANILKDRHAVPDQLTLLIPQLKAAKAAYDAADADVLQARLNLKRTQISAPFDGRVLSRETDIGQYVSPGKAVGTVFSTGQANVIIPLQDKDISLFQIPAEAEIISHFGGTETRYPARLIRTEGSVDLASRMVHAVLQVQQPYSFKIPLENGSYVAARITGRSVTAFSIPSRAERGDKVWLAANGKLRIRKIDVVYRTPDSLMVTGLKDGDLLITSSLFAVTDGMIIRVNKGPK